MSHRDEGFCSEQYSHCCDTIIFDIVKSIVKMWEEDLEGEVQMLNIHLIYKF